MMIFKLSEYNEESEKNGYNSVHPICVASLKEEVLIATFISFDPKMGGNSTPNINHIHIIDEWLQHLDAHIQTNRPFETEDTLSVTFKNGEAKFWMEWKPEEFTIIDVKSLKSIIEDWKNYILNWLKNT